jgi:hypothetical protein
MRKAPKTKTKTTKTTQRRTVRPQVAASLTLSGAIFELVKTIDHQTRSQQRRLEGVARGLEMVRLEIRACWSKNVETPYGFEAVAAQIARCVPALEAIARTVAPAFDPATPAAAPDNGYDGRIYCADCGSHEHTRIDCPRTAALQDMGEILDAAISRREVSSGVRTGDGANIPIDHFVGPDGKRRSSGDPVQAGDTIVSPDPPEHIGHVIANALQVNADEAESQPELETPDMDTRQAHADGPI